MPLFMYLDFCTDAMMQCLPSVWMWDYWLAVAFIHAACGSVFVPLQTAELSCCLRCDGRQNVASLPSCVLSKHGIACT